MRGAPYCQNCWLLDCGIIPACAGSTDYPRPTLRPTRDHPRMCGEHTSIGEPEVVITGSSPHVRGAQRRQPHPLQQGGIIPACAGSTEKGGRGSAHVRDHPRMCGEHLRSCVSIAACGGSSPHVRGAPVMSAFIAVTAGIIPACAGSTGLALTPYRTRWDHPRMCGEHICSTYRVTPPQGSSPHVRGALSFHAWHG